MYNETIKLISEIKSVNSYGDTVSTETEREVFVRCQSIGQSEFYQAEGVGLKPEIKFILSDYLDYNGEKRLKYEPFNGTEEEYSIIRTYRSGNELELTCKRGIDE